MPTSQGILPLHQHPVPQQQITHSATLQQGVPTEQQLSLQQQIISSSSNTAVQQSLLPQQIIANYSSCPHKTCATVQAICSPGSL